MKAYFSLHVESVTRMDAEDQVKEFEKINGAGKDAKEEWWADTNKKR